MPDDMTVGDQIARLASGSDAPLAAGFWANGASEKTAMPHAALDARFEIGSVTKLFTGTLFAMMVEAGDVDPEAPVDDVTGCRLAWADRAPTLMELATHQSGLPNTAGALWWREAVVALGWSVKDPWRGVDADNYRSMLAVAARKARAGRRARYSSMGIGLLGDALAAAGGTAFDRLLAERLLIPLGMHRTGFDRPGEEPDVVTVGVNRKGRKVPYLRDHMPAAGMLASTVDDLIRFLRAALGDGPEAVVAGIRRAQTPVQKFGDIDIGCCWLVADNERGRVAFHNGGTWGSQAHLSVAHDRMRGAVLLSGTHRDLDSIGGKFVDRP
ncbi:MAG: serine hydrolase domain-containing protein [Sphingopyxis sp.]|uniref:serine hydrolase domain-containing protein n=1 Tax=Sphingopyxis sp. TaxID=1908224 RepID=UPI002ABAFBC5|nr:serine hydrolase domain-containing protein [Sphingopyxis sp.]MDZ3830854.1 serine hydrolase domain-containing protein [Sphingopyxis sp.]